MESKLSNEELIGIDTLKQRIDYDPVKGTLTWKFLPEGIPDPSGFNKRLAGKVITTLKNGYISLQLNGIQLYGHRVAFYLYHEWLPVQVDHEDRVRSNIKIDNLRPASHSENMRNRTVSSKSALGIKNVSMDSKGLYYVKIRFEGKRLSNSFATLEAAIRWRDEKLLSLHGDFASCG
ncbi:hypothetical protein U7154_000147 [Kononvirus KKP3711]|uniref:HNH nuclease domain-containing protein n=1 Tax=Enterobacter phage KKP_3711 TaxID=3109398 RepID=A0AAX4Q484_9CAUD